MSIRERDYMKRPSDGSEDDNRFESASSLESFAGLQAELPKRLNPFAGVPLEPLPTSNGAAVDVGQRPDVNAAETTRSGDRIKKAPTLHKSAEKTRPLLAIVIVALIIGVLLGILLST